MVFGDILRDLAVLTLIIFGALGIFWLRSDRRIRLRFWVRFSVLFLVCTAVALTDGSLLSPYGFGWFLLAIGLTLVGVKRIAPKILGKIE